MSSRVQLEAAWKNVAASKFSGLDTIRLLATEIATEHGAVLVGMDAKGRRHLCLPTGQSDVGKKDAQSRGILIETTDLFEESAPKPYVDVLCRDAKLNEMFSIVAADMLGAVKESPAQPFATCRAVLDRWRQLLENERSSLLSREELGGLFAELLVLEALASVDPGTLSSWKGPEGDVHDFVCGKVDIEVKSTQSAAGHIIEINDLSQMERSPGSKLYVAFHRLHLAPGRGRSVPEIIEDLLELGIERAGLHLKLSKAGYDVRDTEKYADLTFELLEEGWFEVNDVFPHLDRTSFVAGQPPPQVKKIRYSLDLAGVGGMLSLAERDTMIASAASLGGGFDS